MSVDPSEKNADEYTDVDPLVSKTLDSALEQLHLDDLENNDSPGHQQESNAPKFGDPYSTSFSGVPPSHIFPHPQMIGMGFIPFSQMIPVPHQNGFFPPPEFGNTGLRMGSNGPDTIILNNSNDASVFNSENPVQPPTSDFATVSIGDKPSAPNNPNDPLWYASNPQTAQNVVDSAAGSSAVEDSSFLEESFPQKAPGGAVRRQTFHAISTNDLISNATSAVGETEAHVPGIPHPTTGSIVVQPQMIHASVVAQSGTVRAQSTSDNQQLFNVIKFGDKKDKDTEGSESNEILNGKETANSPSYAAAYPYGGPLLQPNPVLPGHTPPGSQPAYGIPSPFHGAYGFASPFQFSPVMGNPNTQIPPHHQHNPHASVPIQILEDPNTGPVANSQACGKGTSSSSDDQTNVLPPHQGMHQQSGTPPTWVYGNHPFGIPAHPHNISQDHPHMIHPHNSHPLNNNSQNNRRGGNRGGKSGYSGNSKYKHNKNFHYYHNGNFIGPKHKKNEDASRYLDAILQDYVGNIYSLCKDQHGCRFLQRQLDILGTEAADLIFNETRDYTVELMTDSFGNYLVQKLLERINIEQRITLIKIAAPHFVYIASNPHGTRALQKLVECIDTEKEADIVVQSLKGSIVQLSKDLNGNHIVQKCLQKLQPKNLQFIFDAIRENCIDVATHRHGCCVLQRCLDHGSPEQRKSLCEKLLEHVDLLTFDPFGNYVVQYIITRESEDNKYNFTHNIVHLLTPRISDLSLHKFGSNVVEKILRTPAVSDTVISSFLNSKNESEVQALLNDSYGNYVLQTMLDVSKDSNRENYEKLVEVVRPLLVGPIRNTPHGRRIMSILQLDQ